MKKYLKFITPIFFLLTIFIFLTFKAIPNGKLWNSYSVLYVPVDTIDTEIINALNENNITGYVALSNQYLPINLPANSIELSLFKLNITNDGTEYHQRRNNYFFDKTFNYRLYYIPLENKAKLSNVVSTLTAKKINCGVDSTAAYPWVIPVLALLLVIMLSLFSRKKYLFLCANVPAIIFLYCNPFYTAAMAIILVTLVIFFISNTWNRKGMIMTLIGNYSVPAIVVISLICVFSTSIKIGFLFILLYISIFSVLYTYYFVELYFRSKKSFNPVLIKPARMINIFANKVSVTMILLIVSGLIFIGTFFLTSNDSVNSHFAKILLPANTEIADETLTSLEDYYRWTWDLKTAPYISLNKENSTNLVEYPKYAEDSNGLIRETKVVMAYNQNFKENTFNDIEKLPFNSIEKVISSEGIKFNGGYKSSSDYHISIFGIIMMFISLFILLFLYISIIIRKGTRK